MKVHGRDRRLKAEVDSVPGHNAERRWGMSAMEGQYMLMCWIHVGAEVVGCRQIFGVDAANRLRHPMWVVLCTPKILRRVNTYTSLAAQALISGLNVNRIPRRTINPVLAVDMRHEGGF